MLDTLSDSAVFDARSKAGADQASTSVPPGEGVLQLLGVDFEARDIAGNFPFVHSDVLGSPRRSSAMLHRLFSTHTIQSQSDTPTTQAINYDYAMAFPRTHADVGTRPRAMDVVTRFLSFPRRMAKCHYEEDAEYGLLNHALPDTSEHRKKNKCESCGHVFAAFLALSKSSQKTYCRYCSKVLCRKCCDRKFVIPSYVVTKGDFEVHAICQPCENHLQKHLHSSCIEFNRLSSLAIKAIGKARIEDVESLRARGLRHIYYNILPDCPSRHTLISLIPQNCAPYLSVFPDSTGARVSLADLCELQTSFPQRALEQVVRLLANHTTNCHQCSSVHRHCSSGAYCTRRRHVSATPPRLASTHRRSSADLLPDTSSAFGDELGNHEYESLGYHSFNLQQGGPMPPKNKMKLCRTCSEYCHARCYMPQEAQCKHGTCVLIFISFFYSYPLLNRFVFFLFGSFFLGSTKLQELLILFLPFGSVYVSCCVASAQVLDACTTIQT